MKDQNLIKFGEYLFSDERKRTLRKGFSNEKLVYHSELENWKALQEKGK